MRQNLASALLPATLWIYAPLLTGADYYVAPAGSPAGSGAITSPWDLQTALNHPAAVKPGDTIRLRGGKYTGLFTSQLKGVQNAPILVRNYAGEQAVIDGATGAASPAVLTVNGYWTSFWGIEITNSYPVRQTGGSVRATGVDVFGANVKFINMLVHDNGNGFGFWQGTDNSEIYGCLIYDNGYDAPDRGHGHNLYAQNRYTTKWIRDNITFNAFSYGIHIYGSSAAYLDNFWIEGNIVFNNGILSWYGATDNILLGGENIAQNETVLNNYTYFTSTLDRGGNTLGYDAGCSGLNAKGNYFSGTVALRLNCTAVTLSGNTFYGAISGFAASQFPNNAYYSNSQRTGTKVYVRPNLYEPGRANIVIYNWDNLSSVAVNLSNVLAVGEGYEIRDAQNFYGSPVAAGAYTGAAVSIPMILTSVAAPVGNVTVPPVHTPPEFGTFVVLKTSGLPVQAVNQPPVVSAGSSQTVVLPASATLNGSATDDGLPNNTLTVAWSSISGPGNISFANPYAAVTTATFSMAGTYVLQLSASDGTLTTSSTVTVAVTSPSQGTYINCGGPAYTDPQYILWSADTAYSGGASYNTAAVISGTAVPALYQTVRYGSFGYAFPVAAGYYTVILKFAEVYWTSPGKRIFNVAINGRNVLSNFDIVAQAGTIFTALDRQFTVNAASGRIDIQFTSIQDYASVSAIAVVPSSTAPFNPIRVNAGGTGYTDPEGRVWNADTGYNAGAAYYAAVPVGATSAPALYQSVRYLPLTYTFTVPSGTRTVTLKFGEIYFNSPGQRVFNVLLNGQVVLANFDIVAQAGAGTALDKQFTVNVTDGKIAIQLTPVVENPMISAIEIQ